MGENEAEGEGGSVMRGRVGERGDMYVKVIRERGDRKRKRHTQSIHTT